MFNVGDVIRRINEPVTINNVVYQIGYTDEVEEYIYFGSLNGRIKLKWCKGWFYAKNCILVGEQAFKVDDVVRFLGLSSDDRQFGAEVKIRTIHNGKYQIINELLDSRYFELVSAPLTQTTKQKCDCDFYKVILTTGCKNKNHY